MRIPSSPNATTQRINAFLYSVALTSALYITAYVTSILEDRNKVPFPPPQSGGFSIPAPPYPDVSFQGNLSNNDTTH